jgi:Cu-processing system permease protein
VPILTLAKFTIRGYLKEKILLVVVIFGLILMAASYLQSPMAVGAQQKIVIDVGLASISIFGIVLIVLLGAGSFHQEKERGILTALLVKPITRTDFILGKYAGTVLTVATVMLLMASLCLGVIKMSGGALSANIFWAIYLSIIEMAMVTALLSLFSSFTSPILSSFFTICVVVAGHMSKDLLAFADRFSAALPKAIATGVYYVLPNFNLFNVRSEAVHGLQLPEGFISSVTIYGFFYTLCILVLASLLFRRREVS